MWDFQASLKSRLLQTSKYSSSPPENPIFSSFLKFPPKKVEWLVKNDQKLNEGQGSLGIHTPHKICQETILKTKKKQKKCTQGC